jgi:hypothetical protein
MSGSIDGDRALVILRRRIAFRAATSRRHSSMLSQIDRQIIRSWYHHLVEPRLPSLLRKGPRLTGPRIAVIGNCQAFGVAYAMKLLDPTARVSHFSAIGKTLADMKLVAKTLATYDYVFCHEFHPGHVRGGGSADLCAMLDKVIMFPAITFAAFHPDLVYLLDETRGHAPTIGPVGPYHSALAVFAFRRGMSVAEARALFNRNVFEAVGYFDVWNAAAEELIESTKRKYDLDLGPELANWSRRGVFMYSLVHPKPFVLFDLAKKLMAREGLPTPPIYNDYYAIDDLGRAEIFPVYPPIGEWYGVQGSYVFKLENYHLSSEIGDFVTLPYYLAECFETYRRCKPSQLTHPRIEAWLDDPAAVGQIVTLARENLRAGLLPTS